jgi:hypothetical protein
MATCRVRPVQQQIKMDRKRDESMNKLMNRLKENFFRLAASGWLSPEWYLADCPSSSDLTARTGHLHIEIVSHCWRYSHLLAYQLSSLVLYPPQDCHITATVFYCPEDQATADLLEFMETHAPPNVHWNWKTLSRRQLFRRGIGRNLAAKTTQADWIWFTDCDQLFHRGCLDATSQELQGRTDPLVFPVTVSCTQLLEQNDPLLRTTPEPALVEIDTEYFSPRTHTRAIGALQIMHGDVARAVGYCESIPFYQQPVDTFQHTYEDRALRWLLRTQGTPIDVPALYRIEHSAKGRYEGQTAIATLVRKAAAQCTGRNTRTSQNPPLVKPPSEQRRSA